MSEKPSITIVHTLPGRVRFRLSHPLRSPERLREDLLSHDGVRSADYHPVSRSVLVLYDGVRIRPEEIVTRLAVCLSLDHGGIGVRVARSRSRHDVTDGAVFAGGLILSAAIARVARASRRTVGALDWAAAVGTAASVLGHGWSEVRERGYFDPEVLSLGYLLTGSIRGHVLTATAVTWISSFGRHLIEMPGPGVEVRPDSAKDDQGRCEVVVRADAEGPTRYRLLGNLRAFVKYALTGSGEGASDLLQGIRDMSQLHGEELEGTERMPGGIPMRFE